MGSCKRVAANWYGEKRPDLIKTATSVEEFSGGKRWEELKEENKKGSKE